MKIKYLSLSIIAFLTIGILSMYNFANDAKYSPRKTENKIGYGISGAMDWVNARKVNPQTGKLTIEDVEQGKKAMAELIAQKSTSSINLDWKELGPDNVGGRCRSILFDRNNPNIMYAGGVSGGIWKSTTAGQSWRQLEYLGDNSTNNLISLQVSAITQTPNGDIYFGTGEMWNSSTESNYGNGIWKSTDGENFVHLPSSWENGASSEFFLISRMASDPITNRVYVTNYKGLRISDDGGLTWVNPIPAKNSTAQDVKVGSDGSVVVAFGGSIYTSETGDVGSFTGHTVYSSAGRLEIAIAPQDPNYIYIHAVAGTGQLLNLYRSTDKGNTFEILVPGPGLTQEEIDAATFNPTGTQGTYDVVIAVDPINKNRIILGGLDLYYWEEGEGYGQLTMWFFEEHSQFYVHADQHALAFHPTNPNILFVGSDGGLSKSTDRGYTYSTSNKKFNVTQFYSVGFDGTGVVCGGTQDNGTQLIGAGQQNTAQSAVEVSGGDGGYTELSSLSPGVVFSTVYHGSLSRSENYSATRDYFYSPAFLGRYWNGDYSLIGSATPSAASFVTPIALWESISDYNSIDSILYLPAADTTADTTAGSTIRVESLTNKLPIYVTLTEDLHRTDTLVVQDPYQSMLAIGMNGNVWVNRHPLDFASAKWEAIIDETELSIGTVNFLVFSKDGNHLFFSSYNTLYRASNFNNAHAEGTMTGGNSIATLTVQKIQTFSGGSITGIAVDPQNPNNVVVTLGGYNSSSLNVYFSTNAATTTQSANNFAVRHGNLPKIPVYSAMINWDDSREVIIGTEFGVFSTDNILDASPVWVEQSSDFRDVPVFAIRQQQMENSWLTGVKNHGHIYIGTHGRGIFTSSTLKGPTAINDEPSTSEKISNLNVFPNPAKEKTNVSCVIKTKSDVDILIYSIQGRLVKNIKYKNQEAGVHQYTVNLDGMDAGTYIVNMVTGNTKKSSKLMIY